VYAISSIALHSITLRCSSRHTIDSQFDYVIPDDGWRSWSMSKSFDSPKSFSPELVSTLRSILDAAVNQIDVANRTPSTKAKMAQRILRAASEGSPNSR
jgi:hypothetical protein